jgi:RND family efflux transporter MFP subunit
MVKLLKKRWYLVVLIVAIALGLFFYQQQAIKAQTKKSKPYTVTKKILPNTLSLSGEIDAEEAATLRFQSSGKLVWVGVKEGDYVKKYQGIASLDQREIEKNLQKYMNSYKSARWDLEQSREDNNDQLIGGLTAQLRDKAKRLVEQSQFDLDTAVINYELQNLAKENAYLYTPIEGIVVRVATPYAGINITPSQAEFGIVNPKTIYFSATADQTDVVNLKKEMAGDVILDSYPDKTIKGMIGNISFSPKAGETGTVYEVKIAINENNDDYRYRLGMTGDVEFPIGDEKKVLMIPNSYIKSQGNDKYVMKQKNGGRVKQIIKIGESVDSSTEVTSGLSQGDIIYD